MLGQPFGQLPQISPGRKLIVVGHPDLFPVFIIFERRSRYRRLLNDLAVTHARIVPLVQIKSKTAGLPVPIRAGYADTPERSFCGKLLSDRIIAGNTLRLMRSALIEQVLPIAVLTAGCGKPRIDRTVVMNHDRRPVTVSTGLINIPSVGNGGNIFRTLLYGNFCAQIAVFVFDEDESVPNGVGLVERIDFQMQHVGRQAFRSDPGDPLNGIGDLHFVIDVLLKFHVDRFAGRRNRIKILRQNQRIFLSARHRNGLARGSRRNDDFR